MLNEQEEKSYIENVSNWPQAKRVRERAKYVKRIEEYSRVSDKWGKHIAHNELSISIIDAAQRSAAPLKTGPRLRLPKKA